MSVAYKCKVAYCKEFTHNSDNANLVCLVFQILFYEKRFWKKKQKSWPKIAFCKFHMMRFLDENSINISDMKKQKCIIPECNTKFSFHLGEQTVLICLKHYRERINDVYVLENPLQLIDDLFSKK